MLRITNTSIDVLDMVELHHINKSTKESPRDLKTIELTEIEERKKPNKQTRSICKADAIILVF